MREKKPGISLPTVALQVRAQPLVISGSSGMISSHLTSSAVGTALLRTSLGVIHMEAQVFLMDTSFLHKKYPSPQQLYFSTPIFPKTYVCRTNLTLLFNSQFHLQQQNHEKNQSGRFSTHQQRSQ